MPRVKLTAKQVQKAIRRDNKDRLERERVYFMNWWREQPNRAEMSVLKAAWEAWKARAGLK